jgi:hypothetical protein
MVHLTDHALIEIPAKARIQYAAAHAMRKCRANSIDHTLEKDRVVVEPSLAWRLASRFSLSREYRKAAYSPASRGRDFLIAPRSPDAPLTGASIGLVRKLVTAKGDMPPELRSDALEPLFVV